LKIAARGFRIYFLVVTLHLVAIAGDDAFMMMASISKALLLPILLVTFFLSTKTFNGTTRNLVLTALLFSWAGDVLLLFQETNPSFFLAGLVSFLIAHICYIFSFIRSVRTNKVSLLSTKPLVILPFVLYGIGFFWLIREGLGEMMMPVIAYECIILVMGLTALNRYQRVDPKSFRQVFTGALLFMVSDSLLAVNKFYFPFIFSSFFIMLTYILAQYFIVSGMVQYFFATNAGESDELL
jgi:uncharacterized membrane protein YhhN